ncbi:MAG: hypothetical protein E6Q97_00925 [Desulfurellales bacterium]|nr:MAG: hypothetical protein E6Q97_00925 [Desulfurellales bacterium]
MISEEGEVVGFRYRNFDIEKWADAEKYHLAPGADAHDLLRKCTGFCSCGTGNDFALLLEVLAWSAVNSDESQRYRKPFGEHGTYCSAGHELAAKVLDLVGLVEHGAGIGWCWATAWGKEVLAWIEKNDPSALGNLKNSEG